MLSLEEMIIGMFFTANALFCVAYVFRSMFWLRIVTILAALFTFPYFFNQEQPLWTALFWQAMFVVINAVNLVDLILRSRPVKLTPLEQKLHQLVFNIMQPRDMLELLNTGTWQRCAPGDVLVERGAFIDGLSLVADGVTEVIVKEDKDSVARLVEGDFVGEMSYLTGNAATAEVRAKTAGDYVSWERAALEALFAKKPALRNAMQAALGRNMALKLNRSNYRDQ